MIIEYEAITVRPGNLADIGARVSGRIHVDLAAFDFLKAQAAANDYVAHVHRCAVLKKFTRVKPAEK